MMWCMTKRLSVTLETEDERLISAFASAGSHESVAQRAWAEHRGIDARAATSEAALLRLLLRAGAEALREQVLDSAYAQLAVEVDLNDSNDSRVARDRYVKRTETTHAR